MPNQDHIPLKYFLSEKNAILIVSFAGAMDRASGAVMEQCLKEIEERSAQFLILNFHDVPSVDRSFVAPLARLKKHARDHGMMLKICYLVPSQRTWLEAQGVLEPAQVANNLAEALQSLPIAKKAA